MGCSINTPANLVCEQCVSIPLQRANYEAEMQEILADYRKKMGIYAAKKFEEILKPFLIKNHYSFYSGNNDFVVVDPARELRGGNKMLQTKELPREIQELLLAQTGQTKLGSIMPSLIFVKDSDQYKIHSAFA